MNAFNKNQSSSQPAVLCMAAGPSQLPVVRKAKELGYVVICVDRTPQAPAFKLCDESIVASTYDSAPIIVALEKLCKTYQLVGVLNRSSGFPVISSAEICQAFDLRGPSPQAAKILTDKSLLLAACRRHNIPAARFQAISSLNRVDHSAIEYPCVVKPAISLVGKSGVRVIESPQDLEQAFEEALAVSLNGQVNIEQFIPGIDLSLLSVVEEGEVHPVILRDELNSVRKDGTIDFQGIALPSIFSGKEEEGKVLELAQQVAREFQLDRTTLNLSCRCQPGGQPVLVEVHLDLGGDLFFEGLLPNSTSHDVLGHLIDFLAGKVNGLIDLEFKPAALIFGGIKTEENAHPYRMVTAGDRQELQALITELP